jgi:hypothetical protein
MLTRYFVLTIKIRTANHCIRRAQLSPKAFSTAALSRMDLPIAASSSSETPALLSFGAGKWVNSHAGFHLPPFLVAMASAFKHWQVWACASWCAPLDILASMSVSIIQNL